MLKNLRGRVAFIFEEENFDVDQIVGVKNIKITDVVELAKLAMQSYDQDFHAKVRPGDLLVGGPNFGYGHPHYPPMRAMLHLGIGGVIAESFSPGYWGLVERWDELELDWDKNEVRNLTKGRTLLIEPLSYADRQMLDAGGLIPYLKRPMPSAEPAQRGTSSCNAQA